LPRIKLQTLIQADKKLVFDLSRSIDLHQISTAHTSEKAIAGKLTGLIELNETVTWEARHFGIIQQLTSRISEYDYPNYFVDEMVSGAFKRFRHEHHFTDDSGKTLMTDIFDYTSPLGIIGKFVDALFLKRYMINLIKKRNLVIKDFAESRKQPEVQIITL